MVKITYSRKARTAAIFTAVIFTLATIFTPCAGVTDFASAEETDASQEVTETELQLEAQQTDDNQEKPAAQQTDDNQQQPEAQPEETADEQVQHYEPQADSWRYDNGNVLSEEQIQKEDPYSDVPMLESAELIKRLGVAAWGESNGQFYSSNGKVIKGAIRKGIDVSYHNGKNINWEKVKKSGIDFAILRCGFGNNYSKYDDSTFLRNATECERLGIPYGVYLYSYADSISDAESEANHTLRLLKGRTLSYPVYYDLEDKSMIKLGSAKITAIAEKYCSIIESKGYSAGIYANLNWWKNYLKSSKLDKYEKWVAQYYYECTYSKTYRLWQSTSEGSVKGIEGKVDLNFEFDLGDGFNPQPYYAPGAIKGWVKNSRGQYVLVRNNGTLVTSQWVTLNGKKYYVNGSGVRTTGYKKIGNYYYLFSSSGVMRTGTVKVNDKKYILGSKGISTIYTAKLKTSTNFRTGPSTAYKKKGTYKKGKTVSIIYQKNGWGKMTNGYWLKLKYTKKVKSYPAFVPYKVKTTTALKCRKGPSTKYKVKKTYKKGTKVTIKSVKNGWGKTDRGYIDLRYTKRI